EPYLKSNISDMNNYHIRVDSPSDVIIVTDLDYEASFFAKYSLKKWISKEKLTFNELSVQGNIFFASKNYHQAIRFYTRALNLAARKNEIDSADVKKCLNNRSLANLKLERYNKAWSDALKASKIETNGSSADEKAFYR